MTRRLVLSAAVAALSLGCAPDRAPDETVTSEASRLDASVACPVVATSCRGGCFAVGAHPVDRRNQCLRARQTFGCSPFDTVGPPTVTCSVSPDGTVWVSFEARAHPQGRICDAQEQEATSYPRCP